MKWNGSKVMRKEEFTHRFENDHKQIVDDEEEWKQLADEYSGDRFAPNKFGQLQEDENRFYIIISVQKETNRIKIEMMEWKKISFEQWWSSVKPGIHAIDNDIFYAYALPVINDDECEINSWRIMNQAPLSRYGHSAVWTGAEMIIWSGDSRSSFVNTGGRYNPSTDSWVATSTTNAPAARYKPAAIWTGAEMIIWGGWNG